LEEKCYQLEAFTSPGQIPETWAKIFENGYGYFGSMDNEAVFAHFYRSDVQSARGRYFVPRSILLIPFPGYINDLHCDPTIVFQELKKHKPGSTGQIDKVVELAPIKIPPKREPAFPFQLTESENIDEKPLIDFLSCLLQPKPSETIIWGGEKPDIELLFSLLFLLPRTLRKFITFCTCVESPQGVRARVKIVKDLTLDYKDSSLIIIKDKKIDIREKRIHRQTFLPALFVKRFKQGIDSLNKLHQTIDTKTALLYETDFEKALQLTEKLIHHINRKMQIDAIPDTKTKYKELISIGSEFKNDEQDRKFMLEQIEKGMRGIKPNESTEIQNQLAQLFQMLSPIHPTEIEGITKRFREAAGTCQISELLPLLKVYISIPLLNEAIMSTLFEKLTFVKITGWEQAFEILSLIQNKSQLHQLNKNAILLTQLKQHKEAELFLVLLDLIFLEKEPSWEFLESIADKINGHRIIDILNYGFKYFENMKEESLKLLFFLLIAASMYPYIPVLPQKQQGEEVFETLFIKVFSRAIFSTASEKADNIIDGILTKIGSLNQAFAARLAAVLDRRTLVGYMANLTKVMNQKDIFSFAGSEDAAAFFQLLDNLDHKAAQPLNPASLFFNIALQFNAIPSSILFPGYINYLQKKQNPEEDDMQILMAALTKDCSPLESPDFFREVFSMIFTRYEGESLSKYVQVLFTSAKEFIRENNRYIPDIEYHVVRMLEENWHPQGINEIREIYQAISSCFDIVTVHKVLEFGLSRCFKSDTEKKAVSNLVKMVKDLAVIGGKEEPFEMILNNINIKESNNQYVSIRTGDFLAGIRRKYEGYKSMIGIIDALQKRKKK
ncbi:MAG: hypothetical protein JSV88_18780, partial [Candidatus Aminicenantes bacterium]